MAASFAPSSFYSSMFSSTFPSTNKSSIFVHTHEMKLQYSSPSYGGLHVKRISQSPRSNKNLGAIISLSISPLERAQNKEKDQMPPQPVKKGIDNMLITWSTLLSNVTKTTTRGFVEAEINWIFPKFLNIIANPLGAGRLIHHGLAFRQNIKVRSYEIGFDWRVSLVTIMNYLQDTKINHLRSLGIFADGFGVTPEMRKKNLVWVVTGTDIVVDHYPTWRDMVQVDTWTSRAGRNGVRCDWFFRDLNTGKAIIRVTSFYVMADKETRKLSKFTNKIREELEPHFMHNGTCYEGDNRKLSDFDESSADSVRTSLTPRWIDLRQNLQVNNANYISWILESTPASILESHELYAMNMEYQKECRHDSVLKSLTATSSDNVGYHVDMGGVKFEHLLCLENGTEIARAKTIWRPKYANNFNSVTLAEAKTSWEEVKN